MSIQAAAAAVAAATTTDIVEPCVSSDLDHQAVETIYGIDLHHVAIASVTVCAFLLLIICFVICDEACNALRSWHRRWIRQQQQQQLRVVHYPVSLQQTIDRESV